MLSKFRFLHCAVVVLVFALSASPQPLHAEFLEDLAGDVKEFFEGPTVASDRYCNDYAILATRDALFVQRNRCPLSGNRYGTNRDGHYWWCMGVTVKTSGGEMLARHNAVNSCETNVGFCNDYSRAADAAVRENAKYGCGYSGAMWAQGAENHRAFCLAGGNDFLNLFHMFLDSETAKRNEAINACRGKFAAKDVVYCEGYSQRASDNARKYRALKCESSISSVRWNGDYDFNFRTCLNDKKSHRESEDNIRITKLKACEGWGGGDKPLEPIVNRDSGAFGPPKNTPPKTGGTGFKSFAAPKAGTGGTNYSRSSDNGPSAMDKVRKGNVLDSFPGNSGYTSPATRKLPGKPILANDPVKSNIVLQPKSIPAPSAPAPAPKFIEYGGCSACGKKNGGFVQPR